MAVLVILSLAVGGCAGVAPVPGGTDLVNQSFYPSREEFLDNLNPGTVISAAGH